MTRKTFALSATILLAAMLPSQSDAAIFQFTFAGPGVSGTVDLTYGAATDATYANALEVTGISGTFTNTNIGIVNAPILGLVPITHDAPEPTNLLAPNDFSRFPVVTASDYPPHGGFIDIYGLLFDIGSGRVVNIWSNGTPDGVGPFNYGVVVVTAQETLQYIEGGVAAAQTPEPSTLGMLASGLLGVAWRQRSSRKA